MMEQVDSLSDRSHRPHNIPKSHSEQELKLIKRLAKNITGQT